MDLVQVNIQVTNQLQSAIARLAEAMRVLLKDIVRAVRKFWKAVIYMPKPKTGLNLIPTMPVRWIENDFSEIEQLFSHDLVMTRVPGEPGTFSGTVPSSEFRGRHITAHFMDDEFLNTDDVDPAELERIYDNMLKKLHR